MRIKDYAVYSIRPHSCLPAPTFHLSLFISILLFFWISFKRKSICSEWKENSKQEWNECKWKQKCQRCRQYVLVIASIRWHSFYILRVSTLLGSLSSIDSIPFQIQSIQFKWNTANVNPAIKSSIHAWKVNLQHPVDEGCILCNYLEITIQDSLN